MFHFVIVQFKPELTRSITQSKDPEKQYEDRAIVRLFFRRPKLSCYEHKTSLNMNQLSIIKQRERKKML